MQQQKRFRFVVFDQFYGGYWGTDDEGIAKEHALCEDFNVLEINDKGESSWLQHRQDIDSFVSREIKSIEEINEESGE